MKLQELKDAFGTFAQASRELSLGSTTYQLWQRQGYIPIISQIKIEVNSKGRFKADLGHIEPYRSSGISFERTDGKSAKGLPAKPGASDVRPAYICN